MERRCFGIKKNIHRCSRKGEWALFCHDHKRQPIAWVFIFVFTVLSGSASIYSVIDSITSKAEVFVKPKVSIEKSDFPPLSLRGVINNENSISFAIASDAALVSLFDPLALKHRFRDKEYWWQEDSELVQEMNRGNGIFISTSYDGYYEVLVHGKEPRISGSVLSINLVCEGGLIYVGGNPNDGLVKVKSPFGGDYFSCEKGVYRVEIRQKDGLVDLSFTPIDTFTRNSFEKVPHFE